MFEKLNHIELSGERYPIKCDLLVLEKIQDEYGDLSDFENKLTGFVPDVDEYGEYVRNEEGLLVGKRKTPEIKILRKALIWMIEEGMEVEGETGEHELNEKEIMRKADMPPGELSRILHEEFNRCFQRKNGQTTQGNLKETENQKK